MTDIELVKDINIIMQQLQTMRDTQDKKELEKAYYISKRKLEEIYKDKKELLKERKAERKAEKKAAKKAEKQERKQDRRSD